MVAARRVAQDRLAWLKSPVARAERVKSRVAFRGRMGPAALVLAREKFGAIVTRPLWAPPRLRENERPAGMRGDRVMLIDRGGKPGGLVDSTVPLETTEPDGSRRGTDITLSEGASGFAPVNPVASSRISKRLGDGVSLPEAGVSLVPLVPAPDTLGVLSDERVFYADAAADTDVIAAATPTGAAIFYQLRSPGSPNTLQLDVDVPVGARVRPALDGSGGAEVVTETAKIASVTPPVAVDAHGQSVPARYAVSENRITVVVDHLGGDYAYPILVDPIVDNENWRADSSIGIGWTFGSLWPSSLFVSGTNGAAGRGLYVLSGAHHYQSGSWGWWYYKAPADSFVYRADFGGVKHVPAAPPSCVSHGIYNLRDTSWHHGGSYQVLGATGERTDNQPWTSCAPMNNQTTVVCHQVGCGENAQPGNAAALQYWMYGTAQRSTAGWGYMGQAAVFLGDGQYPSVTGGPAASSSNPNDRWAVNYIDQGLGIRRILIDSPGNPGWDQLQNDYTDCWGTAWSPCPSSWQSSSRIMGNLPPGTHTIRVRVEDAGGKVTEIRPSVTINYHWASWKYGGSNRLVDTSGEVDAIWSAIVASDASARAVHAGLTEGERDYIASLKGAPEVADPVVTYEADETASVADVAALDDGDPLADAAAGGNRGCKNLRVEHPIKLRNTWWWDFNIGSIYHRVRWCYNKRKRITGYGQVNSIEQDLDPSDYAAGFRIEVGASTVYNEGWNGYPRGQLRMERRYAVKYCPADVGCLRRIDLAAVKYGHYDATWVDRSDRE